MQSNGDFKAQLEDANQPGLYSPEQRLSKLVAGANPYVTGTSLQANSSVFFGREQALGEILGTLRRPERPGCVSILGERRIGKSSLLNQIYQALATEPGLVSVHATAQNWNHASQQQFYTRLHVCLASALGLKGEKSAEDYPDLRDFLLNQAKQGRRFLLIIDEFEIMAGNPAFDAYFFSNLRALADRPEYRLGFLTSSRKPLKELCATHKIEASSFWNIFGVTKVLGLLAEAEARDLVVEVFGRSLKSRHTGRYREKGPHASTKFELNGLPDLRMAKAIWIILRMAAQLIAMPCLPLAFKRSQKARMIGLCLRADMDGMYSALRTKGSPDLERRVLPAHLPDCRRRGASPTWATACLASVKW